jgi:glutaredoxin
MPEGKEIVVYARSTYCPYQARANRVFARYGLKPREILIDLDDQALARVLNWTGFRSVPTIVVARLGEDLPYEEPAPLPKGDSPRGIDRGSMITEAGEEELTAWLVKHGFVDPSAVQGE